MPLPPGIVYTLSCLHCGTLFPRFRRDHDRNVRRNRRGPFCSKACAVRSRPNPPQRPITAAAFWARVDQTGDCWLWMGARHRRPQRFRCLADKLEGAMG